MIVTRERVARPSRRRQSAWHPVFVLYRSFVCEASKRRCVAILHTIERRRDPGCAWQYREPRA